MTKKNHEPKLLSFSEKISEILTEMDRLVEEIVPDSDGSDRELGEACIGLMHMVILRKPIQIYDLDTNEFFSEIPLEEQLRGFEDTVLGQYIINDSSSDLKRVRRVEKALINSLKYWSEFDREKLREAFIALLEISECLRTNGDTAHSNDLIQELTDFCSQYFEPTDPLIVSTLVDSAVHLFRLRNLDGSESLLKQALELSEMNPIGTEIYKTRALMNLSAIMCARSSFPLGLSYLDEALTWAEQQIKPDKAQILEILSNQAKILLAMKRREDFDLVADRALKASKEYWRSTPQDAQDCLMTLFGLYQMQNRFDEARSSLKPSWK